MSYYLMVFRADIAPKNRVDFMDWFNDQTEWKEAHDYNDPVNTSPELRNWFMEMIKSFPQMNGPFAKDDDDADEITDYSIGRDIIYMAFSWSESVKAFEMTKSLAEKHGLGFYDISSDNGDIIIPGLGLLHN